jgi:hypothetical protein
MLPINAADTDNIINDAIKKNPNIFADLSMIVK